MIFTLALFVILLAISTASAAPTQTQTQTHLSRRDSTLMRSLHPHRGSPTELPSICTQRSKARGAAELGAGLDEGLLSSPSTAAQLAAFSRVVPLDGSANVGVDVGVEPIEQGERNCGPSYSGPSPRSRQEIRRAPNVDDGRRRERQRARHAAPTRDDAFARIARPLKSGAEASGSRHALLTGPDEPSSGAEPHSDRPPL